eukprot:gnl/TRDRNA2_/TRDRNA2_31015_c0_seq1.p1 gnl/TRDRNA2_/TRDRNA2_31015_c0~~gnl/TRDRNA2_/TRDRNA2_31015_c0_seq1.p1  ORF type:complete len:198 (+),score=45.69 gnl/TRDRNA2_/TRDRNA2_31015_c0_seq1:70-594(+)
MLSAVFYNIGWLFLVLLLLAAVVGLVAMCVAAYMDFKDDAVFDELMERESQHDELDKLLEGWEKVKHAQADGESEEQDEGSLRFRRGHAGAEVEDDGDRISFEDMMRFAGAGKPLPHRRDRGRSAMCDSGTMTASQPQDADLGGGMSMIKPLDPSKGRIVGSTHCDAGTGTNDD